jgi:hypothetical protein
LQPSAPKEDDSEDFCGNEQPSSLSIEFEPLPDGPFYVVSDYDRESTSVLHDDSLEMENSWDIEFCEALTLEFEEKDFLDEHGDVILEALQEPCSHNAFLESAALCAKSTHEDYNHPKFLRCKMLKWMVLDAYVYHKHSKFCGHTAALTLQLE